MTDASTADPWSRTYRVVQWATGNVGLRALRAVIEHPKLELVGLYVNSAEKEGRDAGELCGLPANGVAATRSVDDILALRPDVVLYMPQGTDIDTLCRLLAAGSDVVTTRGDFHNPKRMDPAVRDRIEAACAQGGTSIHSTGSSPGFITEAVPIALTSISRRLDCLTIDEFADVSSRNSPFMIFEVMGYGKPATAFDEALLHHFRQNFSDTLYLIADALGIVIADLDVVGEFGTSPGDTHIAAGTVPAGTVTAQRITVTAKRADGTPVLVFRANWYCSKDIDRTDWELRESGWRVRVAGDTPLDVSITYPVSAEEYPLFTPNLTAHRPINAIPFVVAAEPGIRTTFDLPQVRAWLA